MHTPSNSLRHVVPYPFPMLPTIEGKITGGLPAVLAAEFAENRHATGRLLTMISTDPDDVAFTENNAEILAASSSSHIPPFGEWFSHRWAILHPDAHIAKTADSETLRRMFAGQEYDAPQGSLERVIEHHERYPLVDAQRVEHFTARFRQAFDHLLESVGPGTIINWQDPLFFAELQTEYAPRLKEAGVKQTCHVHTTVPSSLDRSPWGRSVLDVLGQMDTVYVHTDGYKHHLERQFETVHEGQVHPEIKRFDLMIDTPLLKKITDESAGLNIRETSDYAGLSADQRVVVDEMLRTREGSGEVPHRFLCLDRLDPGKGVTVVIDGIEKFLLSEKAKGLTNDQLRDRYRYFALHDLLPIPGESFDPLNLKAQYGQLVLERYQRLQDQFPGVIHICKSVSKTLAVQLMDNCHALTGATQDGLNLAWPETVWVNDYNGRNRFGVMASGAGFAQEALRLGHVERRDLFPEAGDVKGMEKAIATVVHLGDTEPAALKSLSARMVGRYINNRRDSVVVDS